MPPGLSALSLRPLVPYWTVSWCSGQWQEAEKKEVGRQADFVDLEDVRLSWDFPFCSHVPPQALLSHRNQEVTQPPSLRATGLVCREPFQPSDTEGEELGKQQGSWGGRRREGGGPRDERGSRGGEAASFPVPGRAGRWSSSHSCRAQGWAPGGCPRGARPGPQVESSSHPGVAPCMSGYGKGVKLGRAVVTVGSCPS